MKISEEIQVPLSVPETLRKFLYDTLRTLARAINRRVSIVNGYANTAELGSGTASASTYLRGDNTWATPAGGGGATYGVAEVDFGSTFVSEATFTVTDAGVSTSSVIHCFMQGDTTTGNTQNAHIYGSRSFRFCAVPGTGSFTLDVGCLMGMCSGTFKVRYTYG